MYHSDVWAPRSFGILVKTILVVSAGPMLILALYVGLGALELSSALEIYVFILLASLFFVRPYLKDIVSLSEYAEKLTHGFRPTPPELSLFGSAHELLQSINRLHDSWIDKERQMQAILEEWEKLVDTLPETLVMIDANKNIVKLNTAARSLFGQNLAHAPLNRLIDNEVLLQAVENVLEHSNSEEVEFSLLGNEPEPRYFRAGIERFSVHSPGGIAVIITLYDITELRLNERMQADFVANASHEIRTPLTSLLGFIETLQERAKDDPAAREKFLSIMHDQAERMVALVTDLLSLSKIELSGRTRPTGRVDLAKLCRNTEKHLNWQAQQKNTVIKLNLAEGIPPITGDENEITQVLHNLVSNAIKYGYEDSTVDIRLFSTQHPPEEMKRREVLQAIAVSVTDRGPGIPREHQHRLTERFYRVDGARSRKISGTGLGLAIVKHILTRHGAVMDVESEIDKGSVFTVYFPL